jgi:hypothetical protein
LVIIQISSTHLKLLYNLLLRHWCQEIDPLAEALEVAFRRFNIGFCPLKRAFKLRDGDSSSPVDMAGETVRRLVVVLCIK